MNAAHRFLMEIKPEDSAGIKRQKKLEHSGWWN
jgi:hypothetical protein